MGSRKKYNKSTQSETEDKIDTFTKFTKTIIRRNIMSDAYYEKIARINLTTGEIRVEPLDL